MLKGTFIILLPVFSLSTVGAQQKLSKSLPVKTEVYLLKETNNRNLILYHPGQPLHIKDFKGKPDAQSPGVAATYSGIQMQMEGKTINGHFVVQVSLLVYFDKTKSWIKKEGKNEEVLAHEQNHFDLTAIKACQLALALEQGQYTAENVQAAIRQLQERYTTALNQQQIAYDKETQHGIKREKQAEWSGKIANELETISCFP